MADTAASSTANSSVPLLLNTYGYWGGGGGEQDIQAGYRQLAPSATIPYDNNPYYQPTKLSLDDYFRSAALVDPATLNNPSISSEAGSFGGPELFWNQFSANNLSTGRSPGDTSGYTDWLAGRLGTSRQDIISNWDKYSNLFSPGVNSQGTYPYTATLDPNTGMVTAYQTSPLAYEGGDSFWKMPLAMASAIAGGAMMAGAGGTGGLAEAGGLTADQLASNAFSTMGTAGPMSTTAELSNAAGPGFWEAGGGAGFAGGAGADAALNSNFGNPEADNLTPQGPDLSNPNFTPNDILENQGNVTGGGALGTNLTFGQLLQNIGVPGNISSPISNIFSSAKSFLTPSNSTPSSSPMNIFNLGSSAFDVGSGIYGLMRKKKLEELATRSFTPVVQADQGLQQFLTSIAQANNPATAYDPVRELMNNPGMVTKLPGYQFGLDQGRMAINRQGAASGGGGNEAIALARYTPEYAQKFYESEIARRMALGGATANTGLNAASGALGAGSGAIQAGNAGLNANIAANNLASSSLGSIGYGIARAAGGNTYDALINRLLQSAFG